MKRDYLNFKLFMILFISMSWGAIAQDFSVDGVVQDESGFPVPYLHQIPTSIILCML